MKFAALLCLAVFLSADGESIPVEQDSRREELLTQCLVQILSKVLYKTDDNPVHPECKSILTPGSGHSTAVKNEADVLQLVQEELKKPRGESIVKEKELIEDLLKADKREEQDDERSQEEFPSFMKRRIKDKREEMGDERSQEDFPSFMKRRIKDKREEQDDERSQEDFPSFMKRRIKDKREEMGDERSQEDFPSFMKRRIKDKREEMGDERSQEDFPSFMKRRIKDKREEQDDDRSQEDFPSFMKRRIKDKREEQDDERSQEDFPSFYKRGHMHKREDDDDDDERSQEEFPQKRHFSILYKRDNPDEERSQEEFPLYEYKRSRLLATREKREEPDYDRSQEDFPSYTHKRNYGDEEEEDEERDKRIWKPSHRYHHKKKHHKRSENEGVEEPDYDRSQEAFPSYTLKRNYGVGEEEDEESEERDKRIWKPSHRYHHKKKHHKRSENEGVKEPDYDRSQEDFPSYTLKRSHGDGVHHKQNEDLLNEQSEDMKPQETRSEESEEVDEDIAKRYWKPTHRYHHKKHHHKRGDSIELEDEPESEDTHSLHESIDKGFKLRSPEEKETVHELNDGHQSLAEKEAALRYLTKKKNELEERLLNKGDVYEKRSPWIYRGYYHPAWYKRSQNTDQHPNRKLEELAEALRYKRGLQEELPVQETGVSQQKPFTPDELNELEKLASVDQQMKETT